MISADYAEWGDECAWPKRLHTAFRDRRQTNIPDRATPLDIVASSSHRSADDRAIFGDNVVTSGSEGAPRRAGPGPGGGGGEIDPPRSK